MFFIMGISQGEKKLNFDQTIVCNHCGQYGHLEIYMIYSYLSLFFIPIFKWGRRYFVKTTCCGASAELDAELGHQIERGEVTSLPENMIPHSPDEYAPHRMHRCPSCGFETEEDYQYCPKCGQRLN